MDLAFIQAVVSEASSRLTEQEVLRAGRLGARQYLLRFATPQHDNLLVSLRPDLPRLHLTPLGVFRPEAPPDRFAALLDEELSGARLCAITAPGADRLVELRFRRPGNTPGYVIRTLVVELFGRSANALLLDAAGIVLGAARETGTADEGLVGAPYAPPAPRLSGSAAVPTDQQATVPVVYSPRPLAEVNAGMPPGRGELFVTLAPAGAIPARQGQGGLLVATRFDSPSAAAQAALDRLENLMDFDAGRAAHLARIRKELSRLSTLERRLGKDLESAAGTEQDRRRAEALLAGLAHARVAGGEATVPDPESPDGAVLTMPIDPSRSLADNAARLFARWKKGKRSMTAIGTRRAAVRERLRQWRALESRAAAAASIEDLVSLRRQMEALGMVHAEKQGRRAAAAAAPAPATRVRRHTTADGFVVLVGRSGPENDTLTFRVASPWDFWMHAAGTPGAHVVVRNPQRLKSLPPGTLTTAASIAAWYSGAKGEGKVEVHYTQRKHVHKRRGMPAGQVLVRRFRSIQVPPRLPQAAIEDL